MENEDNSGEEILAIKQDLKDSITKKRLEIKKLNQVLTKQKNLDIEVNPNKESLIANTKSKLEPLEAEVTDLEEQLKEVEDNIQNEEDASVNKALARVKTDWIAKEPTGAYIIDDQQFVFIKDFSTSPEKQNIQMRRFEPARFVELLAKELNLKSWNLPPIKVKDLFNQEKRTYEMTRYSIDPVLWHNNDVYLPIQHMEKYFIDKAELTPEQEEDAQASLPFFDMLMYSLSGGKKENQEHIERWILHKIKNYRKAVTTPDIVIVGHVGGNGKGILQAIIRLMLPAMLSGKANSKTLNGNFNAIMLGKLIVFFDDQNSREIPLEVVKQLAGSETMIFEPKGKDQYEGEKTHSSAWFSNTLPFRLTPAGQEGGVDRRFSIMATNITFLESIRKYYSEAQAIEMSVEESKDVAETVVSKYLLNRVNIAHWFKELERRHPEVTENYTLKPLHGEDYQYFLENQRNSYDTIWHELIMPVLSAGGCVPMFVVKELLRHMEGKVIADKTIYAKFKKLSVESKIEIITERITVKMYPFITNGNKQCSIMRKKDSKEFTDTSFNWGLISNVPYAVPPRGEEWIKEDNLIFGIKNAVDDDIEADFDVEAEDMAGKRRNFEKSWEEQ